MKKGMIVLISAVAGAITGAAFGVGTMGKVFSDKAKKVQSMSNKHLELFLMMNQWVKVKQADKNLADYFERKGYSKIAIYGMSYAGESLADELRATKIKVAYGIDQRADFLYADFDIVAMDEDLEEVDAIVVTAITYFDDIEEKLREKTNCPIISLEDILYEV